MKTLASALGFGESGYTVVPGDDDLPDGDVELKSAPSGQREEANEESEKPRRQRIMMFKVVIVALGLCLGALVWAAPESVKVQVVQTFAQRGRDKIPVCYTFQKKTWMQASIFMRNYLQQFGSRLEFHIGKEERTTFEKFYDTGQVKKSEWEPETFGKECPPTWPRLHSAGRSSYENLRDADLGALKIATGDEFCLHEVPLTDDKTRTAFRQYWSEKFLDMGTPSAPWIPLGPRFEWIPVKDHEIKPSSQRPITFNFQGSLTSVSRRKMKWEFEDPKTIKNHPFINDGIMQISKKWSPYIIPEDKEKPKWISVKRPFSGPEKYRKTQLDSTFCFVPGGKSPETFRMYEAIDAGAIPVFSRDSSYKLARCNDAFKLLRDSGLPMVWVEGWKKAPRVIDELLKNPSELDKMQRDLLAWKKSFWTNVSRAVDCEIMTYFAKYRQEDALRHPAFKDGINLDQFCGSGNDNGEN